METLPDEERMYVHVPAHYALVRCLESGDAQTYPGTTYLVLRRFLSKH